MDTTSNSAEQDSSISNQRVIITSEKCFSVSKDGVIETEQFLKSSVFIVDIISEISTMLAPVKYDMMGNISKIEKKYKQNENKNKNLLEMIEGELNCGNKKTSENLLWLTRALLFVELVFTQILSGLKEKSQMNIRTILANAYEGSVKRHHNWAVQQLFSVLSKMCPSVEEILTALEADKDFESFHQNFLSITNSITLVRSRIQEFFKSKNITL